MEIAHASLGSWSWPKSGRSETRLVAGTHEPTPYNRSRLTSANGASRDRGKKSNIQNQKSKIIPPFPPSPLPTFSPSYLPTFILPCFPSHRVCVPHCGTLIPRRLVAAFTLVELLAVVGIMGILAVAAVPIMRGLGGSQSSRGAAMILVSALEQTRTAAILSGTKAYLVLPDSSTTSISTNSRLRLYAIIRPSVDLDGNGSDDFQTNVAATNWVLLSKWERLPGDLMFSSTKLSLLALITPTNLTLPGNSNATGLSLPAIAFNPSGSLANDQSTNGLLFASSNKVVGGIAAVADKIEISRFSGRVRYAGLTNNVSF